MKAMCSVLAAAALSAAVLGTPSVARAGSVGVYATNVLARGSAGVDAGWRKYAPAAYGSNAVNRIQAFYDMMCERVDLMSTNYAWAADKRQLVLDGCPPPSNRNDYVFLTNGVYETARDARIYEDMCAWLNRDPTVVSSPNVGTNVYPDWQSPLCHDVAFAATPTNLTTSSTDLYPCSVTRFGVPGAERVDLQDHLSALADDLYVTYSTNDVRQTRTTLDDVICAFYRNGAATPTYVDEVSPLTEARGMMGWSQLYAFDQICDRLASRNVTTFRLRPHLAYEKRSRTDSRSYVFDTDAIRNWVLDNCVRDSSSSVSATFTPSVLESRGTETVTNTTETVASAAVSTTGSTASGYARIIGYTKNVMEDNEFEYEWDTEYSGGEYLSGGKKISYYYRTLYHVEAGVQSKSVSFSSTPYQSAYVARIRTAVSVLSNELRSANAAFTDRPEYFDGARVTALAYEQKLVVPNGSYSDAYGTNLLASAVRETETPRINEAVADGLSSVYAVRDDEVAEVVPEPSPLTVTLTPRYLPSSGKTPYYELRSILKDADGNELDRRTYLAGSTDSDLHPQWKESVGDWLPPKTSQGASLTPGWVPENLRLTTNLVSFSSSYDTTPSYGYMGQVQKKFDVPAAVCENKYRFTNWSGSVKELSDPRDGLGPRADYGDGDGGTDDFDVWVDASYAGTGDGSRERPFRGLQAAVEAVNPNGGARANTNRVPKVGIRSGIYAVPPFFSQVGSWPYRSAYPVRMIGIGTGTQLDVTTRMHGSYYSESPESGVENVTVVLSNTAVRSVGTFTFRNCAMTGTFSARYCGIEESNLRDTVLTNIAFYARESDKSFLFGSWVTNCFFNVRQHPSGRVSFSDVCYIEDSIIEHSVVESLYGGANGQAHIGDFGCFYSSTINLDDVTTVDHSRNVYLCATNCLFFVDDFAEHPPYSAGNFVTNKTAYVTLIDPLTLTPRERFIRLRAYGYRQGLRQE